MPVWLTVLLTLGLPISTLLGALVGAWVSRQGAENVAKVTLEGQKAMAHDAALRDYRRQQIEPYREAARRRLRVWYEISGEVGDGDTKKWRALQTKYEDPEFGSLVVMHVEIPDEAFRDAFQKFVNAEGDVKSTDTFQDVKDIILSMRQALAELSAAAEHYIFAAEKDG
jgi:hypothetical protein